MTETSRAFRLPAALRARAGAYDPLAIESELRRIQRAVDAIAFDLYGLTEADCPATDGGAGPPGIADADDGDDTEGLAEAHSVDALLSWAAAVAFGRFDWRLATR